MNIYKEVGTKFNSPFGAKFYPFSWAVERWVKEYLLDVKKEKSKLIAHPILSPIWVNLAGLSAIRGIDLRAYPAGNLVVNAL